MKAASKAYRSARGFVHILALPMALETPQGVYSVTVDTLTLPLENRGRRQIKNFAIGWSVVSNQLAGVAGFGRGGLSMPSQPAPLFRDKFAYCLDYVTNSSKIVMGNKAVPRDIALTYTPLFLNPVDPSVFSHYYLGLEAVSIGGKRWTFPSNLLSFDSQGNGGTLIDSGSSYSYFPDLIYNQIAGFFASQIAYRRLLELKGCVTMCLV